MKLPNGQWEFLSFFISWEVFIFNASEQVLGGFVFVFVSYKEGTNVKGNAKMITTLLGFSRSSRSSNP